jgi:hypothetical protein
MATVFARLKIPQPPADLHRNAPPAPPASGRAGGGGVAAEEDHGVHAFLVPLRDAAGRLLPGVEIRDCGYKVSSGVGGCVERVCVCDCSQLGSVVRLVVVARV